MLHGALAVEGALLVALDVGIAALQLAVARIHLQRPAEDLLGVVAGPQKRRGTTKQRTQTRQPDPHGAMQHGDSSVNENCVPAGTVWPPKPGALEPGLSKRRSFGAWINTNAVFVPRVLLANAAVDHLSRVLPENRDV